MSLRQRLKKALALFILISFTPIAIHAQENPGKFARVLKEAPVPFDAWCFDDIAMAKIQTSVEFQEERCQLKIQNLIEKERAAHSLQIDNLQLRLTTAQEEAKNIISIKNDEIALLEKAALKRPNDYVFWWASGGFITGAATVLGIFFLVK